MKTNKESSSVIIGMLFTVFDCDYLTLFLDKVFNINRGCYATICFGQMGLINDYQCEDKHNRAAECSDGMANVEDPSTIVIILIITKVI